MKKEHIQFLFKQTINDYNTVANDYTRTRVFIPEDIKAMADYAKIGDRVLDSGCASGRLFGVLQEKNVEYFGIDISEKLIDIAKKTYPEANFQVGDALNLPFPNNYFDKVFSVSVLHHIPSKELQMQYLKETHRVLKTGGLLVFRVWDFWRRKSAMKLILKYTFLKLIGKSKLDFNEVFVPWKDSTGSPITQRYFHCFTKNEIKNLAIKSGLKTNKLWRAGKDPRTNIYLIAEKASPA